RSAQLACHRRPARPSRRPYDGHRPLPVGTGVRPGRLRRGHGGRRHHPARRGHSGHPRGRLSGSHRAGVARVRVLAADLRAFYAAALKEWRIMRLFGSGPAHLVQAFWMFLVIGIVLGTLFHVPIGAGTAVRALVVIAISVPAFLGLGALFAALVLRFKEVNGTVQLLRGVFQVLCGVTFPIVVLPLWSYAIAVTL